jgi:hypothetical protein
LTWIDHYITLDVALNNTKFQRDADV